MRNPNQNYKGPLSGVRVLDFTWVLAGPQGTAILADFGAEVIRIESLSHPDSYRRGYGPFIDERRGPNVGGKFNNYNRNKLSITLDMAKEEGRDLFRRLVEISDVVTENFSGGVMEGWGFAYEGLSAINPRIIYLSMAGLGHFGPHAAYRTFGPTIQSLSGLTYLGGLPGRQPSGWGFSYMDHTAGHYGALAVIMALYERSRSGLGQHIDLAQVEVATTLTGASIPRWSLTGEPTMPPGNDSEDSLACPQGVFPCEEKDRWIAIAVKSDEEWQALCKVIGRADLASDSGLDTVEGRIKRRDEIEEAVTAWTRQRDPRSAQNLLQAAGVPAGAVQNAADIAEDPQIQFRGVQVQADHPEMGPQWFEGVPIQLSRTPGKIRASSPLLGEHIDYVFRDLLGLDESEVARLKEAGVV